MVKSVCMRAQPFSHAMRITVRYKVVHSSLVCLRPFSRQNSMVIIVSHFTISHVMQNTVKYKSVALFPNQYAIFLYSSFKLLSVNRIPRFDRKAGQQITCKTILAHKSWFLLSLHSSVPRPERSEDSVFSDPPCPRSTCPILRPSPKTRTAASFRDHFPRSGGISRNCS